MSENNMPGNKSRKKQLQKSRISSPPPIVLVPETPPPLGDIPIATEDEATPTPAAPPSPTSYASIAALPAARSNVVVWPRNPAVVDPVSYTPPLGQSELKGDDTMQASGDQGGDTSTISSSLPSSSPIQFTSSDVSTPTLLTTTGVAHSTPTAFGATASSAGESYESFWGQVRTPLLSDTNMPSALQTPRILSPTMTLNPPDILWPTIAPASEIFAGLGTSGDENRPPSLAADVSHPPVASRMRKRRRGHSPIPDERVKKSARRKGKRRATETVQAEADVFGPSQENPWAAGPSEPSSGVVAPVGVPRPNTLASHVFSPPNLTPYDDYRRGSSATTSFYERFNVSGSYPTPHRLSDSPAPVNAATTSTSTQLSSPLPASSAPPPSSRCTSRAGSRQAMDVDQTSEDAPRLGSRASNEVESMSLLEPIGLAGRRRAAIPSHEARRRLRDALSDPREEEESTIHYRSPAIEDVPEEGELPRPRGPRASSNTRSDNPEGFYRQNGFTLPPLNETPWNARDADPSRASQSSRWNASSLSSRSSPTRGYDEEREARGVSRDAREDMSIQYSSTRQRQTLHDPPHPSIRHDQRRYEAHPRPSTMLNANRINGLDVFDVGDDDNLPDAVRRGGTTQDGEVELPTPIPFEGDPEVHRHDPEAHLRGMSDTWVQEVWADPMNTSITLNTFNPRYSRSYGTNRRTASDLRRFVSQITGESDFLVIAPDQAPDHRGRGPVEWAITGLTREGVDRLLRRRVWSFKSITFFPRRRALDNPTWLLALEGFLEDNVSNIEAAVRSTFERPQVRQRILQMIHANPEFNSIPADEAFRRIMATLRVSVYTLDNETVVANVFLRSPTQSIRVWRRWILELRDLTFGSYHTAIARVRRISSCAGCLGVDHPSHLCPFTRLPSWNGPESAGGNSYSVDGRERRARQQLEAPQNLQEPYNLPRRQRNQPHDTDFDRAGPSRSQSANGEGGWENRGREQGRDGRRDNGPGSSYEYGRRGLPRRGKKDAPGQPKHGRDSYRKDGRR